MSKIRCNEYDCKHNYDEKCMRSCIEVSKEAKCDSFDTKNDGSPIDVEFGLEENYFKNHNDKEVVCHCTTCKTNHNNYCTREHLQVADVNDVAKCESYERR